MEAPLGGAGDVRPHYATRGHSDNGSHVAPPKSISIIRSADVEGVPGEGTGGMDEGLCIK